MSSLQIVLHDPIEGKGHLFSTFKRFIEGRTGIRVESFTIERFILPDSSLAEVSGDLRGKDGLTEQTIYGPVNRILGEKIPPMVYTITPLIDRQSFELSIGSKPLDLSVMESIDILDVSYCRMSNPYKIYRRITWDQLSTWVWVGDDRLVELAYVDLSLNPDHLILLDDGSYYIDSEVIDSVSDVSMLTTKYLSDGWYASKRSLSIYGTMSEQKGVDELLSTWSSDSKSNDIVVAYKLRINRELVQNILDDVSVGLLPRLTINEDGLDKQSADDSVVALYTVLASYCPTCSSSTFYCFINHLSSYFSFNLAMKTVTLPFQDADHYYRYLARRRQVGDLRVGVKSMEQDQCYAFMLSLTSSERCIVLDSDMTGFSKPYAVWTITRSNEEYYSIIRDISRITSSTREKYMAEGCINSEDPVSLYPIKDLSLKNLIRLVKVPTINSKNNCYDYSTIASLARPVLPTASPIDYSIKDPNTLLPTPPHLINPFNNHAYGFTNLYPGYKRLYVREDGFLLPIDFIKARNDKVQLIEKDKVAYLVINNATVKLFTLPAVEGLFDRLLFAFTHGYLFTDWGFVYFSSKGLIPQWSFFIV